MKALKTFRDVNKKYIESGDSVDESKYSNQVTRSYVNRGFLGKTPKPSVTKPAKPSENKAKKIK